MKELTRDLNILAAGHLLDDTGEHLEKCKALLESLKLTIRDLDIPDQDWLAYIWLEEYVNKAISMLKLCNVPEK